MTGATWAIVIICIVAGVGYSLYTYRKRGKL